MNKQSLQINKYKSDAIKYQKKILFTSLIQLMWPFDQKCEFLEISFPKNQYIGLEGAKKVVRVFQYSSDLKTLKLTFDLNNSLTSQGLAVICEEIKSLNKLTKLSLQIEGLNQIDEIGIKSFGECLLELKNLQKLSIQISRNNVSKGIQELMLGIESLTNLISFNFSIQRNVQIGSNNMKYIQDGLKNLINLKSLTLKIGWQAKINKEGAQHLGEAIGQLKNLEFLDLQIGSDNNICSDGLISISKGISSLKLLKQLNIQIGYQNNIDDVGLKELGLSLTNLISLNRVNILIKADLLKQSLVFGSGFYYFNHPKISLLLNLINISQVQMFRLQEGLRQLNQIKNLQLKIKRYQENLETKDFFIRCFKNLKELEQLQFELSQTEQSVEQIGQSFLFLNNLKQLSISFKQIKNKNSISEVDILSQGIKSLSQLECLQIDLSEKNIIDSEGICLLLDSIKGITNLRDLDLKLNSFGLKKEIQIQIIQVLKSLINLNKLSIQCNSNLGEESHESLFDNIRDGFDSMNNLRTLSLKFEENILSYSNCFQSIGLGLLNLKQLQNLKLYFGLNNKINCEGVENLSRALLQLKQLQKISIIFKEGNLFCTKCAHFLGAALSNQKEVEKLELQIVESLIELEGVKALYEGIKLMKNLQKIKIDISDSHNILLIQLIQDLPLVNSKTFQIPIQPQLGFQKNQIDQNTDNKLKQNEVQSIYLSIDSQCKANPRSIVESIPISSSLRYLYLNIEYIQLGEEGSLQLGKCIGNLSMLSYLYLSINGQNQIGSIGAQSIGQGVGQLINLRCLYISIGYNNNIDSIGAIQLAKSVQNLNKLQELEYIIEAENNFLSDSIIELSKGIQNINDLHSLSVSIHKGNIINSEGVQALSQSLKNFYNLEKLNISISSPECLNSECIEGLVNNLKDKRKIKSFNISIDHPLKTRFLSLLQSFDEILIANFFKESIKILNTLKDDQNNIVKMQIDFMQNESSVNSFIGFCKSLKDFIQLESFDLQIRENIMQTQGAIQLGDSFKQLINIKQLKLTIQQNNIGPEGAKGLFEGIKYLINITELNIKLFENLISEEGGECLGFAIQNLTNLQFLNLYIYKGNQINVKGGISIGNSLSLLTNLRDLSLFIEASNKIGYQGVNSIKNGLLKLKYLENIQLQIQEKSYLAVLSLIQELNSASFIFTNEYFQDFQYEKEENKIIKIKLNIPNIDLAVEGSQILSEQLKSMCYLNDLNLLIQQNNISQHGAVFLGQAILELRQLNKLQIQIDNNNIKCIGAKSICQGIEQLENLSHLTIIFEFDNNIKQEGGISLGKCLRNLKHLEYLKIKIGSGNNIDQEGGFEIGNSIKLLMNLQELELDISISNQIKLRGVKSIVDGIRYLQQQQYNNQPKEQGKENLSQNNSMRCLKTINFNIEDKASTYIISLLSNNNNAIKIKHSIFTDYQSELLNNCPQTLTVIIERRKDVTEEGAQGIGEALTQLLTLKKLTLQVYSNSIQTLGAIGLSKGIQELKQLEYLNLAISDFGCILSKGAVAIGQAIGQLVNLTFLSIFIGRSNQIDEQGGLALGLGLANLKQLKELYLKIDQYNEIQYVGSQAIYNGIKNLKNLQHLELTIIGYGSLIFVLLLNELPLIQQSNVKLLYFDDLEFEKTVDNQISHLRFNISYYYFDNQQGCIELCKGLSNFKSLIELVYTSSSKGMNQVSTLELGKSLEKLADLNKFEMQSNNQNPICDQGAIGLSLGLNSLSNLRQLKLSVAAQSQIEKKGFSKLIGSICSLKNLRELYLLIENSKEFNQIPFQILSEKIMNLSQLNSLDIILLGDNQQPLNLKQFIDIGLVKLTQLQKLNLALEQVESNEDSALSKSLYEGLPQLRYLTQLCLKINTQNVFKAEDIKQISQEIGKLKSLQDVQLCLNDETGVIFINLLEQLPLLKPGKIKIDKLVSIDFKRKEQQINHNEILQSINQLNIKLNLLNLNQRELFRNLINEISQFKNLSHLSIDFNDSGWLQLKDFSNDLIQLQQISSLKITFKAGQYYYGNSFYLKGLHNLKHLEFQFYQYIFKKNNTQFIKKKNLRLVIMK